ncbi:MAG: hypothetical protein DMF74_00355 [Acidobacteria bacterium]|nr:MAG: hypothetical protein DMF74_00355 [Acidobacteriota bacterium]
MECAGRAERRRRFRFFGGISQKAPSPLGSAGALQIFTGRLQPRLFPKNQTGLSATSVALAVAAQVLKKHRVIESTHLLIIDAGLERPARDAKLPATKGHHLRHERQVFQRPFLVERRENFSRRAHLYQIAGKEFVWLVIGCKPMKHHWSID